MAIGYSSIKERAACLACTTVNSPNVSANSICPESIERFGHELRKQRVNKIATGKGDGNKEEMEHVRQGDSRMVIFEKNRGVDTITWYCGYKK
jgi:hypothetical protein